MAINEYEKLDRLYRLRKLKGKQLQRYLIAKEQMEIEEENQQRY